MRFPLSLLLAAALVPSGSCSCTGKHVERGYGIPTVDAIVAHLRGIEERARSFRSASNMDYWLDDQRVKGDVLLMGEWGARFRFNALNPTGDNVAADLACDGSGYQYIDYNKNCQLTGVCSRDAIAGLLRVSLAPDDFVMLALGSTPVIAYAQSKLDWDSSGGHEVVDLTGEDGYTQHIVLDGVDHRWDVLESTIKDPKGKPVWVLQNKDFHPVKAPDGTSLRLPGKTFFKQPQEKADLLVRWKEQELNVDLPQAKFTMNIPAGLPECHP